MPIEITPDVVSNYGALTIFFAFVLSLIGHWYFKRYPREQKERSEMMNLLVEQIVLSRQALDTSNLVIKQNIDESKEARGSHQRLGERMKCVENSLAHHDYRAEEIAKETHATRTEVAEVRRLIEHLHAQI
ncbi:MAG: hypothetical protein RBS17_07440 [Coriobacteriia bacterium]|nr:hypothetical protein [Coriobacteriia bacterium]